MAMVPHERSLVTRLQSKPFALLGVDCDKTPEQLRKAEEQKKITWRSWFNGSGIHKGPIRERWNIKALPTIYVLDTRGVIRYKNVEGKEMDEAVESLLKEASGGGTK